MINTKKLEKRWYKYKSKKVLSSLSLVASIPILFGGSYFLYMDYLKRDNLFLLSQIDQTKITSNTNQSILTNVSQEKSLKEVSKDVKSNSSHEEVKEELSLEPVIPIIDMDKEERVKRVVRHKKSYKKVYKKKHYAQAKRQVKAEVIPQVKKSTVQPTQYLTKSEIATVSREPQVKKFKKINLHGTSHNYIETIHKKFLKSNKPREALLLAKAYYNKGDYSKAEAWSLKANKLDSNLEESWLLFAKAKAKLGKKQESVKILASYYKKTRSSKAKVLINKVKRGQI